MGKKVEKNQGLFNVRRFFWEYMYEESNFNFLIWIPLVSLKIIKDGFQTPSWKNTYLYNKLFDHDLRCYSSDWWNINCFVYPIVIHIDKLNHMFHQMHLRLDSYMFIFNLIFIQNTYSYRTRMLSSLCLSLSWSIIANSIDKLYDSSITIFLKLT